MMEGEDNMLAKTPDTDIELMMLATNLIEVDGSGDLPPVEVLEPQPEKPERPGKVVRYACREYDETGKLKGAYLVPARGQRIVAIRILAPFDPATKTCRFAPVMAPTKGKPPQWLERRLAKAEREIAARDKRKANGSAPHPGEKG
jgi:hypothetical protein